MRIKRNIGSKIKDSEDFSTKPSSVIFLINAKKPVFVNANTNKEKILKDKINLYFNAYETSLR